MGHQFPPGHGVESQKSYILFFPFLSRARGMLLEKESTCVPRGFRRFWTHLVGRDVTRLQLESLKCEWEGEWLVVSGGESRFEASFKALVLQTQSRRARARGCRAVRTVCRFQDTAERRCWRRHWPPRRLLGCWGRKKEAPKGRLMGNEVRGFFSEQERRVRSGKNTSCRQDSSLE